MSDPTITRYHKMMLDELTTIESSPNHLIIRQPVTMQLSGRLLIKPNPTYIYFGVAVFIFFLFALFGSAAQGNATIADRLMFVVPVGFTLFFIMRPLLRAQGGNGCTWEFDRHNNSYTYTYPTVWSLGRELIKREQPIPREIDVTISADHKYERYCVQIDTGNFAADRILVESYADAKTIYNLIHLAVYDGATYDDE